MAAFLGMRGNGDWSDSDMRPKSWRDGVLWLYPNGDAPLTALLAKMSESKTPDPEFKWWTQSLPAQGGTVDELFDDAALGTGFDTGAVSGQTVYAKVEEAVADFFRVGHQALLRDASDYQVDTNGIVTAVVKNGSSSYIAVKLIEDENTGTGTTLDDADTILVIGSINAEGAAMPAAIAYDPTKFSNYTQIFRTSLSITRTARLTTLRTGDAYKKAKREALELHSIEMERAFLFGARYEGTGSNGKPERATWGLIPFITNNNGIVSNFAIQTDFQNTTWLASGEEWLDFNLEQMFRYGSDERLAYCGSGVILAINKLVKEYGDYSFTPKTTSYGIKVMEWVTPFGVIHMKRHPLFSFETTNRYSMVAFEPKNLTYRYITDTTFYADPDKQNTGRGRIDGTDEEFLTECGLEFHHPSTCAWLNGFNSDNGTP